MKRYEFLAWTGDRFITEDECGGWVRYKDALSLEQQRDQLVDALRKIDADLEGRNFLESSSLRDTARSALAAADGDGGGDD